jgi:ATP-dependent DNA helicase RecG
MEKDRVIEFGKDDGDEYLSHSVWTDEEEIDGVVEKEFYFNKDEEVNENKPTTAVNNTYNISFDDDVNLECNLLDLRLPLIQQYLYDIKNDLWEDALKISPEEIGKNLDIIKESSGTLKVKNIGVLMFTERPKEFIPGSYIELTRFKDSFSDDTFVERFYDGPIHEQIRGALRYIKDNVIETKIIRGVEVVNYPLKAIKEAVINAVYHKNYQLNIPIEIKIDRKKIVIISYPGADKFINKQEIDDGEVHARIYRNLRIGEFFKKLEMANSKGSGLGKIVKSMGLNNSPKPIFNMDEDRRYFSVILNINESFLDEKQEEDENINIVEKRILELLKDGSLSKKEIADALGYKIMAGDIKSAFDSLLDKKYIESTVVRESSRNQKYRLIK